MRVLPVFIGCVVVSPRPVQFFEGVRWSVVRFMDVACDQVWKLVIRVERFVGGLEGVEVGGGIVVGEVVERGVCFSVICMAGRSGSW